MANQYTAHSVGPRTLLAKNCSKCGHFKQGRDFWKRKSGIYDSECRGCKTERVVNQAKKYADLSPEEKARVSAYNRKWSSSPRGKEEAAKRFALTNSKSREHATRHGQPWTGPEIELLDRKDLSAWEISKRTGRTVAAVNSARSDRHRGVWRNHRDRTMMKEEEGY